MRVMVLVKATADSEAGMQPGPETTKMFEEMGAFNQRLIDAGVMESGDGLKPSSEGKRIAFDGPNRAVIDGPFSNPGELVAGYWIWKVRDMAEAVEWAKQCPNPMPGPSELEIRPFYETEDLAEAMTPELIAQEQAQRERLESQA